MQKAINYLYPFAVSATAATIAGLLLVVYSLATKHSLEALNSNVYFAVFGVAIVYSALIGLVAGLASSLVRTWLFMDSPRLWTYIIGTPIATLVTLACISSAGSLQTEQNIPPIALVVMISTLSWSIAHFRILASGNNN